MRGMTKARHPEQVLWSTALQFESDISDICPSATFVRATPPSKLHQITRNKVHWDRIQKQNKPCSLVFLKKLSARFDDQKLKQNTKKPVPARKNTVRA